MLAIRLQRTGRRGHAQFRLVVQDERFNPSSGRVVTYVGSYNPHSKAISLDSEKIGKYLANGAQPSQTVIKLLKKEGLKMPGWVSLDKPQEKSIRNPEKLRRNRPAEAKSDESEAAQAKEAEVADKETEIEDNAAPAVSDTSSQETEAVAPPEQDTAAEDKPA
jgi:small subunit ribosomal protein S16